MEFSFALGVGFLAGAGVFLMLRGQTFPVILGLTLLSYAVNLFLFASGRLMIDGAAILGTADAYSDPLPQALVLTAIVIGFAMTAFVIILAIRARTDLGNDQVDGRESSLTNGELLDRKYRKDVKEAKR
ncbi:Na+/H+ antiporter subunit C [Oceanobacter kriegii]|uniref:Na+/H+ antiporter subunit C n=1 Tax=Oceanobacter kriegii TaxID=64972 RepID=UPI00040027E2|nr:Na+/H+ antiporter subunit C [Oceanobacter kriegii]